MSYNEYSYLCHYGILGMKWGIRRYQNKDGSLTSAGRVRYGKGNAHDLAKTHAGLRRRLRSGEVASKTVKSIASNAQLISLFAGTAAGAGAGLALTGGNPAGLAIGSTAGVTAGVAGSAAIAKIGNKRLQKIGNEYQKLLKENNPVKLAEIDIKPGTKFVRTSTNAQEPSSGRMYVGYNKDKLGEAYYKSEWPKFLRESSKNPNIEVYSNTLKTKVNIKAPDYETRKEAANAIIKANKALAQEIGKSWIERNVRFLTGDYTSKGLNSALKNENLTEQQVKDFKKAANELIKKVSKEYDPINKKEDFTMLTATIPTNDKLMNAYIKELKKQGYGAVFDDNAATSEAAFIVFDASNLEQTKSKKMR